jgi:hypothetical protein
VAPTVFKVLKPEDAARLQRALFPKYYLVGIACAAVGIVCAGLLAAEQALPKWPAVLSLLLLAAMGATNLWLRQTVVPEMAALRDQRAAAAAQGREPDAKLETEWKTMHRLSIQLNVMVLLCGIVVLFLFVWRAV